MGFINRFLYGKLTVDEVKSPIFKDDSQATNMFFEQYRLKMDFTSLNGWKFKPNQKFNNNRKIDENGYQKHIINTSLNECIGFFSGSTGWGWGIFKEEDMISYKIAKSVNTNCINYSQVAYNLSKIYTQVLYLKFKGKLPEENIIYLGINEVFSIANNQSIFESPRDTRVNNAINVFEKYYYSLPLTYIEYLKAIFKRFKIDVAQMKNSMVNKKAKKPNIKLDENEYFTHIEELLNVINELNKLGNFTFVLEPSIFHKQNPTKYEKNIIEHYQNTPYEICFKEIYSKINIYCKEKKIKILDVSCSIDTKEESYWDYCHPSSRSTQLIARSIFDKINK